MTLRILILNILCQFAIINHTFTIADPTYLDSRCSDDMVFPPHSKHQTNLYSVFHNLSLKAATASSGTNTNNNVFGLFLCLGDQTLTSCKDCVMEATRNLAHSYCPLKKAGVIWYTDCMVRYSNESFFGKMEDSPKVIISNSRKITGNQSQFTEILDNAMTGMILHTNNNSFYANVVKITRLYELRILSQCTPDLTANDCTRCLKIAVRQLPVSTAGRVLQPSCNVWYEVYKSNNLEINNGKDRLSTAGVIVVTLVPVALVSLTILTFLLIIRRARMFKTAKRNGGRSQDQVLDVESCRYDKSTLQSATNNFSEGNCMRQDYRDLFKGILSDGSEIVVERWAAHRFNIEEPGVLFMKLQHKNLQRFHGFCRDGIDTLMVFEYVPYDLTGVLFDKNIENRRRVDWGSRFKIIKGIARGMLYLHQDSRLRIVHRDIKSCNVLLDEHMNPKISLDFGIAKILQRDHPQILDAVRGTMGYLCPEYLSSGRLSVQTDVYSFGLLILEIIMGWNAWRGDFFSNFDVNHPSNPLQRVDDSVTLKLKAWECWRDGRVMEFVDEAIKNSDSINEIERCFHLGLLCAQVSADQRPTMATVVLMLESQSVTLSMPEQPAYMSNEESNQQDQSAAMLIPWSVYDATTTEMEPR